MKRILAFLCVLTMLLSVVNPAVNAADQDLQAVIDAGTEEIIVLEADASNVTVNRDTIIDLNGHNIDGVTVLAGTLYCMDSQTADYTVADGVYGHVTNVEGDLKAAEGYLQVGDSFHAVNLDIYAMTLRAADVGVYYKSNFAADEIVAAEVESFGVALSVVTAPSEANLETYCGYSVFEGFEAGEGANATGTSTLLKGIMKAANGDSKNAKNAAMPIYGRAYIKTAEGYVFGETVGRSLQEQVEAIDGVWEKLTDAQKAPVLGMLEAYAPVMEGWNIPNIQGIQVPGADGEIEIPIEVTAENGIVTEEVTVSANGVTAVVPAGVKLAEGAEALTLTVTPKETSDTGIELEKNEVLMPMDVHVEGLAADNAQPLTISLGKVMPENLNMGNYTVYHVENGKANEMVLIPVDAQFTAHNQYKYTLDGEVILYVANFSLFAMRSNTLNAWGGTRDYTWYDKDAEILYIRNADQLAGFGAIVGGMAKTADPETAANIEQDDFADQTVVLLADIAIGDTVADNGKVFYPIGYHNSTGSYSKVSDGSVSSNVSSFEGIFDGAGHTISDFYQNTWEMFGDYNNGYSGTPNHYKDAMGLFGFVRGGTVQNLTVENFSSDGEFTPTGVIAAYADGNATFKNIALFNCNPRVYNTGNGGIVGWDNGGDTAETASNFTFENITIDKTNEISALWGSWDVGCAGVLGYLGTHSKAHFEKCNIAAKIDVNNDVCANYQYYWYRYCGMLIGTVDKTKTENGLTVLDLSNITANETTVNFGDWNDYYYCELVANSLASYTYDHQFSRLEPIASIDDIKTGDVWTKTGNFLLTTDGQNECYHIVNKDGVLTRHFHADSGYETTDVDKNGTVDSDLLMEDKYLVNLPFNQVFGGYGWGVKGTQVSELGGITVEGITAGTQTDSAERFAGKDKTWVIDGKAVYVGDLFSALAGDIRNASVQVAATDPNGVVTATYVADTDDWTKGTITFNEAGTVQVTITDYFYCIPTTITLRVLPTEDKTYTFKDYTEGVQYPKDGEEHKLDDNVTITNTQSHFTSELRIYSSSEHNGYAIIESAKPITAIAFNAGYKKDTLNIYGYNTLAAEWELIEGVEITLTTYNDYVAKLGTGIYNQLKLDVAGDQQIRIASVTLTTVDISAACEHSNTVPAEAVAATCTTVGYTAGVKCNDCGAYIEGHEEIAATGHVNTESVDAEEATCQKVGYTAGTYCNDCATYIEGHEEQEKVGHSYVDSVCKWCSAQKPTEPDEGAESWTLVTDASTLKADDQVVIVAKDYDYALSTTQNNNNRGQAAVKKSDNTITFGDDVQILTLKAGTTSGTFAFNTGSGYLYAASSSSNYLRTQITNDANSSWEITIAADGTATIIAQGTNTRNTMQYNQSSKLFACYASASQKAIVIYKLTVSGGATEPEQPETCTHEYNNGVVTEPTCTEDGYTTYTCTLCGHSYQGDKEASNGHKWVVATCEAPKTCSVCNKTEGEALGHNYVEGECDRCGKKDPSGEVTTKEFVFELGENGSATHNDGSSKTSYSATVGGYTLSLEDCVNMYTGARDAKGNSCIKLGASSKTGGFSFTVPEEVTSVVIYIAKYKTNASKVSVNDTTYTLSNNSNDGLYDAITVDTSTNKTVTLTTMSGGYRAMVNTIKFIVES